MRIAQVVFFYDLAGRYGGPTVNVRAATKSLLERGHEVTVFATDLRDLTARRTGPPIASLDGARVVYLRARRLLPSPPGVHGLIVTPALFFGAGTDLVSHDVVHIHGYRNFLAAVAATRSLGRGVPYIVQARGTLQPMGGNVRLKKSYDAVFGKRMLQRAARVVALTEDEKALYRGMGVPSESIEVVPNGVDLEGIRRVSDDGGFRERFGIGRDERIVLFLGRLHATKAVDVLVEAFARVPATNTRLVIVGPDEGVQEDVERLAEERGLGPERVVFTGPIYGSERYAAYGAADVYVRCSYQEGQPTAVLEALACGTPVVLSEACGMTSSVDGQLGLVADTSAESLAAALTQLLCDDELLARFRENIASMGPLLSIESTVDRIESIYSRVSGVG